MSYTFGKVISQSVDLAGKIRITVSVTDGKTENWIMLKFTEKPTDAVILTEANKVVYVLNNPPPKEQTMEDLKAIIAEKDILIVEKDTQIASLKAVK
jgi:hypothetical protein